MSDDKVFLDTNIFVYCFITGEEVKGAIARKLLEESVTSGTCVASYQVWQEFISVGLKKSNKKPATLDTLMTAFSNLSKEITVVHSSHALFARAYSLCTRFQFQWNDSLIVAAAVESGCKILYSEDMHDGLAIDGMTIVNPFKTPDAGLN